jgi:RNA polymerase sigma-70 factor, ECF subfamily
VSFDLILTTPADETRPVQEQELIAALRAGDEAAFMELVMTHQDMMLRVASSYVRTRAVAEEVVQEAWLGVLNGIDRFEGRSSLKTWIFRILTNIAKTRAVREGRSLTFTDLDGPEGPAVDPDRFFSDDHRWAGHWATPPASWAALPESRLLARETIDHIRAAIARLPIRQQQVIALRDVEGWSSEEVCAALEISEGNQRVLLHRARAAVRDALERDLGGEQSA